ncbi:hypothetical protein [Halomarina rubra]|uniref:Uncharacterized protein n=1 Tax=Halomarina rubra TaxID=2071873 RepID=A0ABD6AVJ2_9EURY|nr:hypothetical protein [Halomarina rubra]
MNWSASRRQFLLTGSAAVAGVAGCLTTSEESSASNRTDTTGSTDTPNRTDTATPAGTLAVSDTRTKSWAIDYDFPDSKDVFGEHGKQYLLFDVAVEGTTTVPYTEFELVAGDTTYQPTKYIGIADSPAPSGFGDRYTPTSDGWVAFHVPEPLDASSVVLRWPGGEYDVEDAFLDTLAEPPAEFAVREFAVGTADDGTRRRVTLTVENTGGVDGTFVALVAKEALDGDYFESVELSLDVPAGEAETWTRTYDAPPEAVAVYLRWAGAEREVELAPDERPTTAQ